MYDVFISYRRESSESAQLVATHLRAAGYKVFIDVEQLRAGKFNEQLYEVIDNCKDFVLILPENALDRCNQPEDWVRKELCRAIQGNKNIIPVMLAGFTWPDPMPEGMESLKDYQAITATSREYFDLSMQRLKKYLKSRSHARLKKWLTSIGIAIATLVLLIIIGIQLAKTLSLPFYTKVADDLTMQTSVLAMAVETSDRLDKVWGDFYSAYQKAGSREKTNLLQDLGKDTERLDKEVDQLRTQLDTYKIDLTPGQVILLGLRDISSDDVLASAPFCNTFLDDVKDHIDVVRTAVEDGEILLEEDRTIRDNTTIFQHSANIFYYCYLDIMSNMPEKALRNYNKLVTEWRNFPNGVGLSHTKQEYEQYVDKEVNYLRDFNIDYSKRLLDMEQDLVYKQEELDVIVGQYVELYEQVLARTAIDTTQVPLQNWSNIVTLSSFLPDALDNEADPEGVDMPVTSTRICKDLEQCLKAFGAAYPVFDGLSAAAIAYYREVASGKSPYGGLVVIDSQVPEVVLGDIVTKVNGKKTTTDAYPAVAKIFQEGKVTSLSILRLENGTLQERLAKLSPDQQMLNCLPLGFGE